MGSELTVGVVIGAALSGTFGSVMGGAQNNLTRLGDTVTKLTNRQKLLSNTLAGLKDRPVSATARLRDEYTRLGVAMAVAKAKQEALTASITRGAELKGKLKTATAAAAAVAVPVVKSIGSAMHFQDQIRDIAISGDLTREQEEKLGAAVRKAAQKTAQGHDAMLAGVGVLVNRGMDSADAGKRAELMGKISTASKVDPAAVGKAMMVLANKMGIEGDEAQKDAFSRMIRGSKGGGANMDAILAALPELASSFRQQGIQGNDAIRQIVASMEVGEDYTGSADAAVANLKNWMSHIKAPEIAEAYKKAGVDYNASLERLVKDGYSTYDASLEVAQKLISSKGEAFISKMNDADKAGNEEALRKMMENAGLNEVFDLRTVKHLLAMRAGWDRYKAIKADMASDAAGGALDTDFARRAETASVQWDKFKTSISELGITIGSTLLPAVTDILETVTPVITAFSDWAGEHPFLIKVGLGLTAGMLGMRMAVLGVRLAFNLLGRAMLTNPIGIIIGVIILAASLIIEYWGPIKGFFTGLWGSIKRETIRAWNWIKASIFSIWNSVSGWFRARWNDIKEAFSGGIGGVAKLILDWSPLGLFYKAFAGVMSYFGIDMPKSFSEFGANLIGGLVDGVKAKFTAAKDAIVGFGKDIAGWFKSALGISSPSKVFAGFGDNIAVGAAMGVTRSAPAASRASAGMAADMAASAASQRINAARAGSPGGTTAAAGGAGMSIKFSPTINVQGGGSGIKEQVTEALKMSMHELEQMMARVAARQARTAY